MKNRINIQPPISSIGALLQSKQTHWLHPCRTSHPVVRQLALKNRPSVVKYRDFKLSYNSTITHLNCCQSQTILFHNMY